MKANAYKLLKTESGCTLIFLDPNGSEHEHERWQFSVQEFNEAADRATDCFPNAFQLACAHARGDLPPMVKPNNSFLCLSSKVYFKNSASARCIQDHFEILRIGSKYHLFLVREQLGFHFIGGALREDYRDQGKFDSLAEATESLGIYLDEFHQDESAARKDNLAWQHEQERSY